MSALEPSAALAVGRAMFEKDAQRNAEIKQVKLKQLQIELKGVATAAGSCEASPRIAIWACSSDRVGSRLSAWATASFVSMLCTPEGQPCAIRS